MSLHDVWQKHGTEKYFNYADIQSYLNHQGQEVVFDSGKKIVERGEFPSYVYFIVEGIAIGQRLYEDGNEYRYFQIDNQNGNIGLLEILGKKETYVATINCLTDVTAIKIDSALIYELIMTNLDLLKKCTYLLADDLYKRSDNDGLYYFYSGVDKVRLFLINYYNQNKHGQDKVELMVDMSYAEIANQVGVSARTIGRSIKEMKTNNEVNLKSRRHIVSFQQYQKMKLKLSY